MNKLYISLFAALIVPVTAVASDVNVNVRSAGQSSVTVAPGAAISYDVTGELSDALNSGLAFIVFDLEVDGGGTLSQASAPTTNPMLNFATPVGVNNPAGYGGTVQGGKLIQVGGAQNTWVNTFAAVPSGTPIVDVAKPGQPVTLVSGSVNAPLKVGTYHLTVTNLDANVIKQGESGLPFWSVEAAGAGTNSALTIVVSALTANVTQLSVSSPGSMTLSLDAGIPNANKTYWMLGSFSGTTPGVQIALNTNLPLNYDSYFAFLLANPNTFLQNSVGVLNAQGQATSLFTLPAGLRPSSVVGLTVSHAYFITPANNFASEARSFTIVP